MDCCSGMSEGYIYFDWRKENKYLHIAIRTPFTVGKATRHNAFLLENLDNLHERAIADYRGEMERRAHLEIYCIEKIKSSPPVHLRQFAIKRSFRI